jgi:cytochrome c oxidase subunit IV
VAEEIERPQEVVPPRGETVHLPEPSYLPVILAAGITIGLVGVVISWILVGLGVIVTAFTVVRWVRDTRQDISDLPLEH